MAGIKFSSDLKEVTAPAVSGYVMVDTDGTSTPVKVQIKNMPVGDSKVVTNSIKDQAVTTEKIANNAVTTTQLKDASVTAAKLASGAVTNSKLSPYSIMSGNIAPGEVWTANLADVSVTEAKLADSSVTAKKIADNAVTTTQLKDASVTAAKLGAGAVTNSKLSPYSIMSGNIAPGEVWTANLADVSVTEAKLADSSVTAKKIADTAVTGTKLGTSAVTAVKLATSAVTESKLASGAVTAAKLASNAVTNAKVIDGAISSAKIQDEAVTLEKLQRDLQSGLFPSFFPNSPEDANVCLQPGLYQNVSLNVPNPSGTDTACSLCTEFVTTWWDHSNHRTLINAKQTAEYCNRTDWTVKRYYRYVDIGIPYTATGAVTFQLHAINSDWTEDTLITTSKIENESVTSAKLAANSITNTKISNGAVTYHKLANDLIKQLNLYTADVSNADECLWPGLYANVSRNTPRASSEVLYGIGSIRTEFLRGAGTGTLSPVLARQTFTAYNGNDSVEFARLLVIDLDTQTPILLSTEEDWKMTGDLYIDYALLVSDATYRARTGFLLTQVNRKYSVWLCFEAGRSINFSDGSTTAICDSTVPLSTIQDGLDVLLVASRVPYEITESTGTPAYMDVIIQGLRGSFSVEFRKV